MSDRHKARSSSGGRFRKAGVLCSLAFASACFCLAATSTGAADQQRDPLKSATTFLSPQLKGEQADDLLNRGMLWVDLGETLWKTATGLKGVSCQSCHGTARETMRGVAARYPRVDQQQSRVVNLEGQINVCRAERQGAETLPYESNDLLGLTSFVSLHSRGLPKAVVVDDAMRPFVEEGRRLFFERQGQFNLSCAQCHDDSVGRRLRGDTISSGLPTGYPVYRLEWQGMGSLHRRLRSCQLGVRAVQFEAGSPEYLAIEAYLAVRSAGHPMEAPALRR